MAGEAIGDRLLVSRDCKQGRGEMAFAQKRRPFHHKAAALVGIFLAGRLEFAG